MGLRRFALCLLFATIASSSVVRGGGLRHQDFRQAPADDAALFREAVDQYRAGSEEAATSALRGWSADRIEHALRDLSHHQPPGSRDAAPDGRYSPACIMTITEAAFDRWRSGDDDGGQTALRIALGRVQKLDRQQDAFGRRWFRAAAATLHRKAAIAAAVDFINKGLSRYPDDPGLLLASGSIDEWRGSLAFSQPAWTPGIRRQRDRDLELQLRNASGRYRKVLQLDPANDEARLRLGRVLDRLGKPVEAAELFDQALRESHESFVTSLASLFLGWIAERAERPSAARDFYVEAARARPDLQAAYVALAHEAYESGDADFAAGVLERWLEGASTETPGVEDPWAQYEFGQGWRLTAMIDELRGLARQ